MISTSAFLLILLIFTRAYGSEPCNCVPAKVKDEKRLAWLPPSFCCEGVASVSSRGVICKGDGPFEDKNCSIITKLKAPSDSHPFGVLGYHEGAKRVASCSEDGKMIGIEVGWNVADGKDHSMYAGKCEHVWHCVTLTLRCVSSERFISEVRILCSTRKLDLRYGSKEINLHQVNDSILFGATMHNATDQMRAVCSEDGSSSVIGITWREAKKKNAGAARISGMTLMCSSGEVSNSKHSVFLKEMKRHDRSFACSGLIQNSTLSKLAIWYSARSMAGLDFLECKV